VKNRRKTMSLTIEWKDVRPTVHKKISEIPVGMIFDGSFGFNAEGPWIKTDEQSIVHIGGGTQYPGRHEDVSDYNGDVVRNYQPLNVTLVVNGLADEPVVAEADDDRF
jgi:hypothetical protein